MLLEQLRDFEWYNEPLDVSFDERGMKVLSRDKTDFWQSLHHKFYKDDGHFFFTRKTGDFSLVIRWDFETNGNFDQCGIMLRIDERNWLKASVMFENFRQPMLGSCATNNGYSDWAAQDIPMGINQIWYKIKRIRGDYVIYFSLDGIKFKQIRMLHLLNDMPEVKVGAYVCSPQREGFEATLSQIDFD